MNDEQELEQLLLEKIEKLLPEELRVIDANFRFGLESTLLLWWQMCARLDKSSDPVSDNTLTAASKTLADKSLPLAIRWRFVVRFLFIEYGIYSPPDDENIDADEHFCSVLEQWFWFYKRQTQRLSKQNDFTPSIRKLYCAIGLMSYGHFYVVDDVLDQIYGYSLLLDFVRLPTWYYLAKIEMAKAWFDMYSSHLVWDEVTGIFQLKLDENSL